jgi:glucose/arabinose dehydrogenase
VTNDVLDLASEQVLLEVEDPFQNHNGGHLAFGPDGMLYASLGDGGAGGDPLGNGQDLSDLFASILRIDVSGGGEYSVPPDNPFVDTPNAAPEVYAHGLRNPWRFSFDRETGDLWAGDVGQDRWEEVDRIVAGGNYGWSILEGTECFADNVCDQTGLEPPRAVYGRDGGCSVTGGYVYRGEAMPELQGYYVYADFCTGNVWAVDSESDTTPPILLVASDQRVSSFAELAGGELLLLTYGQAIFHLARGP